MHNQALCLTSVNNTFNQVETTYEPESSVFWYFMNPSPRPCFNPQLLDQLKQEQQRLREGQLGMQTPRYSVLASKIPDTFNLGGDLQLFTKLIANRDEAGLRDYAYQCIDLCYWQATNLGLAHTTIALVQGCALGGGFEAALSCSAIVAEKHAKFGFPEILFNLFPGMGAYSFIARRLDPARAERIILSGKLYSAQEMYDMGLVDVLVEQGDGVAGVRKFIERHSKSSNGRLAMQKVKQIYQPIDYQELKDIADTWVEAALKLGERDFKLIERLIRTQNKRRSNKNSLQAVRSATA